MSLIQQALEKTNRAQETRTTTPAPTPTWDRDPMGAALERELIEVQQKYARRRNLYWKVSLGVLLTCLIGGISYVGMRQVPVSVKKSSPAKASAPVASQTAVRIYSGNLYRLTGITDLSGHAIAVINGRLLGVGDALDGQAVVRSIGNGAVVLEVHGKEIRLTL